MRVKRLLELIMHTGYTLSTARLNWGTLEGSLSGLTAEAFYSSKIQNLFECMQGFPLSSLKSWLWICSLGCGLFGLVWNNIIHDSMSFCYFSTSTAQTVSNLKFDVNFQLWTRSTLTKKSNDKLNSARTAPLQRHRSAALILWKLRFQVTVNIFLVCSRNCLKNCIWPRLLLPVFITLLVPYVLFHLLFIVGVCPQ